MCQTCNKDIFTVEAVDGKLIIKEDGICKECKE